MNQNIDTSNSVFAFPLFPAFKFDVRASLGKMIGQGLFERWRRCAIHHFRERLQHLIFRTEEISKLVCVKVAESFQFR